MTASAADETMSVTVPTKRELARRVLALALPEGRAQHTLQGLRALTVSRRENRIDAAFSRVLINPDEYWEAKLVFVLGQASDVVDTLRIWVSMPWPLQEPDEDHMLDVNHLLSSLGEEPDDGELREQLVQLLVLLRLAALTLYAQVH